MAGLRITLLLLVLVPAAAPALDAGTGPQAQVLVAPAVADDAQPPGAATRCASFSVPLAQAWKVPFIAGRPALAVVGSSRWQVRALDVWPDGSVKWAQCTAQVTAGAGAPPPAIAVSIGSGSSLQPPLATVTAAGVTVDTGPLQADVRSTAFNLLDRVVVDGLLVVKPGTSPGIVALLPGGQPLTVGPTTVAIVENGPERATLRVDGSLRKSGGVVPVDFTCRMVFEAGSRDVQVDFTVRNASLVHPQHAVLGSLELVLHGAVGSNPQATLASPDGPFSGPLAAGSQGWAYQAYSSATTAYLEGSGSGYVPDLPKTGNAPLSFVQEGYAVGLDTKVVALGDKDAYPRHPFADLTGAAGGITVSIRHMPFLWPAALEVTSGGDVTAGLFTHRNPGVYTFCWRQHESRTAVFSFHAGPGADPEQVSRRLEAPVVGRLANVLLYDLTGVFPTRLVSVAQQNALYALLGIANNVNIGNDPLTITRFLPAHLTGGENNHDYVERLLVSEYLRFGTGGQWLTAMDRALYLAEWQIERSDDFLDSQDPGATNPEVPHSSNFQGDTEHRYRDGLAAAYWLSGDERLRSALFDEAEILPSIDLFPAERSAYQTIRALCSVAEFTHASAALDPVLRNWIDYLATPILDVNTAPSGFGWEAAPGLGQRGYYAFGQQNIAEKFPGENYVTRGFVTACLGPMAYFRAARHLGLQDPDGQKAALRLRDLATYTRGELFPHFADPQDRHLVYSYGVKTKSVISWDDTDFHTILMGMAEAWRQTGNPAWLITGIEQMQAFAVHGDVKWLDRRVEVQHFDRALIDALVPFGIKL